LSQGCKDLFHILIVRHGLPFQRFHFARQFIYGKER
jgi:hypothetical protein